MRKLFTIMLIIAVNIVMLAGCNNENNEVASEVTSGAETESETVSEEGTNIASEEVSEVVSEEMTIEEKILAEMSAKMEVQEGYEPVHVTKEMILERYEEIKITEGPLTALKVEDGGDTYADDINEYYISALLTLNASYMNPEEFHTLTNEFCPDMYDYDHYVNDWGLSHADIIVLNFDSGYCEYIDSNSHGDVPWGEGYCSATPDKLLFDSYLINQAEQINYLQYQMQMDEENQEMYYHILEKYLYYNQNEYLTFDYDQERIYGSGLAALQRVAQHNMHDNAIEYNLELVSQWWEDDNGINVFEVVRENLDTVLNEIE